VSGLLSQNAEQIVVQDNMAKGVEDHLITRYSYEKNKKFVVCMAFWKSSFETTTKRQTDRKVQLVRTCYVSWNVVWTMWFIGWALVPHERSRGN
tara:strand:+ start:515 stop:796 length:282 start_codon:yes stop_codon:yes gene_type:complete